MNGRLTALVLALSSMTACFRDIDDYSDWYFDPVVPLAASVRPGAASPADTIDSAGTDPRLPIEAAKASVSTRRGAAGWLFAPFSLYVPESANSDVAAVTSPLAWGFTDAAEGAAVHRFADDGEVVAVAPFADGAVTLACGPGGATLFVWSPGLVTRVDGQSGDGLGREGLAALGACDRPVALGVSDEPGALLIAVDGAAWRAVPGGAEAPVRLGDVPDVSWLDEGADGVVSWVIASGEGGLEWADSAGGSASGSVDGDPLVDGVWRGADGALRVATAGALWRWSPPSGPPEQLAAAPDAPVDAAWAPVGAVLLARAVTPNPDADGLTIPVGNAVAAPTDDGWEVHELPVTPCTDDASCRRYGESELRATVGDPADPVPVYDVWLWTESERHETWCAPI